MPDLLEVHVFGGKIGESIALKLPDDRWGVVDYYTPIFGDPGSNPTLQFLRSKNVTRLEFVCLTHPHADHFQGMSFLLETFPVRQFWIFGAMAHARLHNRVGMILRLKAETLNQNTADTEAASELVEILDKVYLRARRGDLTLIRLQLDQHLMTLPTNPALTITALGASGRSTTMYEDSLDACFDHDDEGKVLVAKVRNVNHNQISGGLLIEYGQSRIILGGDIEKAGWREAMKCFESRNRLASTLVKVSHHGSANGYCRGLWRVLSPNKSAHAVVTAYTMQRLPSRKGLSHIRKHAKAVSTTSKTAVALATSRIQRFARSTFGVTSANALLALQNRFPVAHEPSDLLLGRCSLRFNNDGTFTTETDGEAGRI